MESVMEWVSWTFHVPLYTHNNIDDCVIMDVKV